VIETDSGHVRYSREVEAEYTLKEQQQVPSVGPSGVPLRIGFCGEAPGAEEEKTQIPFIGKAGKFLRGNLSGVGIYAGGCYFTNTIDRRPPKNNYDSVEAGEALELQRDEFWEEMKWLHSQGLRILVALGNSAKDMFGIKGPMKSVRGSVYEINLEERGLAEGTDYDFVVMPTYHPSSLLRGQRFNKKKANKEGEVAMDLKTVWCGDLEKAKDIMHKGYTRPIENFNIHPSLEDIDEYQKHPRIAVDIETTGLDPIRNSIMCIGLASSATDGLCINMVDITHSQALQFKERLNQLFRSSRLLFQNAIFDVNFLRQKGFEIPTENIDDVMLLHHARSPELDHNLGFITSQFGVTPYWKGDFKARLHTIRAMPWKELATYNIRDCVVLHQIWEPLYESCREAGVLTAYEENLWMIDPVIEMQNTGVKVSRTRLKNWIEDLKEKTSDYETSLREMAGLPDTFDFGKASQIRYLLFGETCKLFKEAADYEKHREGTKVRESKRKLHDTISAVTPLYRGRYRGTLTKAGENKTDKDAVLRFKIYLTNRIDTIDNMKKPTTAHHEEREQAKKTIKWLGIHQLWKQTSKLLSTYTTYPIKDDGRVHPSYLIHGTATGRLSATNPAIQTIPKRDEDKMARKIFVAAKDHVILSADYSNLEFRTMAYETGEPNMLRIIEEGLNMHDENTRILFGIEPDHPDWDKCRAAAKVFQFATQYGGGEHGTYEKIIVQVPDLDLSFQRFKKAREAYFEANPVYNQWAEATVAAAEATREVWNAFGRKRILYGPDHSVGKQALNFPSQSAAAHVINGAASRIYNRLHGAGLRSTLQSQIHDQLLFEVDKGELPIVARLVREEMEAPVAMRDRVVVFPVDMEVGPSWGELTAYDPED
jgi:uracil-DNA glycosylase family 4